MNSILVEHDDSECVAKIGMVSRIGDTGCSFIMVSTVFWDRLNGSGTERRLRLYYVARARVF